LVGLIVAEGITAPAFAADPAADRVKAFYAVLLDTMKQAKTLGFAGRYKKLDPAIDATFDIPAMTRVAVGASWAQADEKTRADLIAAFRRLSVANYAHNFDGYDGERFEVSDTVETRGAERIVDSKLIAGGDTHEFRYRMRDAGAGWKIIDVLEEGSISELARRRSEFEGKDAASLVKQINELADKLST
jgi:phospholipid transport system substrate-binding protein